MAEGSRKLPDIIAKVRADRSATTGRFLEGNKASVGAPGKFLPDNEHWRLRKRAGRYQIPVTPAMLKNLEKLAGLHATEQEIADFLEISLKTLQRILNRNEEARRIFEKSRASGKISLRRAQFAAALGTPAIPATDTQPAVPAIPGDVRMQIWLGKQLLGQRDMVVQEVDQTVNVNVSDAREILRRKFHRVLELAASGQLPQLPDRSGGGGEDS